MRRILGTLLVGAACGGPVLADCDDGFFTSLGEITTKGGGTYSYGVALGDDAVMVGTLIGGANDLPEVSYSLYTPYHIPRAGTGLARLLAPEAAAAEPKDSVVSVAFDATTTLPKAVPGTGWQGKFAARIHAFRDSDYNQRVIGTAELDGTYRFLDDISAEIEGCPRRIIPVELELTWKGQTALKRRVLYFPDLGVSVITGWGPDADGPARKTGITGFRSPE